MKRGFGWRTCVTVNEITLACGVALLAATTAITATLPLVVLRALAGAWVILCLTNSYVLTTPVAYPGGPRPPPPSSSSSSGVGNEGGQRLAAWGNRGASSSTIQKGDQSFSYFGAEASHAATEKRTPAAVTLTGEPCGRQTWFADGDVSGEEGELPPWCRAAAPLKFSAATNPNSSDLLLRSQLLREWVEGGGDIPSVALPPAQTAKAAAHRGIVFYQMLQCEDGHWAGDYGGPLFLLPGFVIACYVTRASALFGDGRDSAAKREGMVLYLRNHQQADGGWGTHIESPSTVFGSVLNYVALRLLGISADDSATVVPARAFLKRHGGALRAPSWAKFWLAVLGVYSWEGCNSVPPEMWLLPAWLPFHPGRLWCHCRMVYLPMCYLYGNRFAAPGAEDDPLRASLREELYPDDGVAFADRDWDRARRTAVSELDVYSPPTLLMRFLNNVLAIYERRFAVWGLRKRALDFAIEYIHAEDEQTNYIDIGPVSKVLNMVSVFAAGSKGGQFEAHVARLDDYLWCAEDGVKVSGYNGSQCWDTSFACQAILATGMAEEFAPCLRSVYRFLDKTQIADDEKDRERYFRHVSKGGWPFSTAGHGWPISDCTAEGLKSVLQLHRLEGVLPADQRAIGDERLFDAVNVLLTLQNAHVDGGWATYEQNRGFGWFEWLNPSEVFGDIMIDYSYVECSSAAMAALAEFREQYPRHRPVEIRRAISMGREFISSIQREDGSWYGSWGVCFTYGTWFGIEGLVAAGEEPASSPGIKRAVAFLLSKQRENGGWGESYLACVNKAYPEEGTGDKLGVGGSGVVQTAWAMLGLMDGGCAEWEALQRGAEFLVARQLPNGDWEQEGITGVFNRNCGITYTAYRNIFPIWALGKYQKLKPRHAQI